MITALQTKDLESLFFHLMKQMIFPTLTKRWSFWLHLAFSQQCPHYFRKEIQCLIVHSDCRRCERQLPDISLHYSFCLISADWPPHSRSTGAFYSRICLRKATPSKPFMVSIDTDRNSDKLLFVTDLSHQKMNTKHGKSMQIVSHLLQEAVLNYSSKS